MKMGANTLCMRVVLRDMPDVQQALPCTTLTNTCVSESRLACMMQGGKTPLHLAAMQGRDDLIKVLVDYKADLRAQDSVLYFSFRFVERSKLLYFTYICHSA